MKHIKSIIVAALFVAAVTSQAQTISLDAEKTAMDAVTGPWGAGAGLTHSTSGTGASVAFVVVSYNLLPATNSSGFNSGPIVGYDDCFAHGKTQINSLSGGWDASFSGHWFSFIGKTFLTNIVGTATGYQMLATPKGGGPIGAITGGSISLDVAQWIDFHVKPSFVYNNRNGQQGFNGNFLGGMLLVTHDF